MPTKTVVKKTTRNEERTTKRNLLAQVATSGADKRKAKFYTKKEIDLLNEERNYKTVLTSPQMAIDALQNIHPKQRGVKPSRVALYREDMKNGLFFPTGEPTMYDKEGRNINGLQRLTALGSLVNEMPNLRVPLAVLTNVDDSMYPFLDGGLSRTSADEIQALGIKSYTVINRCVRLIHYMNFMAKHQMVLPSLPSISRSSILDLYKTMEHMLNDDYVKDFKTNYWNHFNSINKAAWLSCKYLTDHKDPELSKEFHHKLATADMVSSKSSIMVLRNKVRIAHKKDMRLNTVEIMAHINMCWNHYIKGVDGSKLTFKRKVASRFPYPNRPK